VIGVPYIWLLALFAFPFVFILKISLSDQARARPPYAPQLDLSKGWSGLLTFLQKLDLGNFQTLISDGFYLHSYVYSLQMAALGTMLTLLVAYPMAYGLTRAPRSWQPFLLALVVLPFWTSFLVRIYAWITILKPNGFLDGVGQIIGLDAGQLALLNTSAAVQIGIVYSYLPFMVLPLYATLDKIDDSLLEAARDLGSSAMRAFFVVTVPLSMPGVLAGCLLIFIPVIGEFVIPDLLGRADSAMIGKTLWTEFFNNRDWTLSAAIAIGMLIILALPIIWLQRVQARDAVLQATGAGMAAGRRFSWINRLSVGFGLTFTYVPLILVILYSFNANRLATLWGGFSLHWYGVLFANEQLLASAWLSFQLAALSASAATLLGIPAAYAMVRFKAFRGRGLFGFLLLAPMIMPSMVIGLSLLLLFVALGLPRGFFTLFLAHTTFCLSYVAIAIQARLVDFDATLEQAAADLYAKPLTIFRRVTLPLIMPSVLSAWALAFVLSFDDLVISSFTTGPGATTLPMRLYSQIRLGVTPEINAASTLLIVAAFSVLTVLRVFRRSGK
jgi:putrescine transport system permease protein